MTTWTSVSCAFLAVAALTGVACSSSSSAGGSCGAAGDRCLDSGASSVEGGADTSTDAPSEAGCGGTAPVCFGNDIQGCCGQDPFMNAVCAGGAWMCGTAAAPGCNGKSCFADGGGRSPEAGADAPFDGP